jgi:peroxiredoxin
MTESLNEQYAALHAERVRTMDPAKLAINIAQRQALVDAFDPAKAVRAGDVVAPFELLDVRSCVLSLDELVAGGPVVLVFFRFAGCPACNLALPYYQRTLWPQLKAQGVRLVAVSPQVPERLVDIQTRHDLGFDVASDPGNTLARRWGLTFEPDAATRGEPTPGWIGEVTGTGTWELPQPAVVIVDRNRVVRFAEVSPDWMVRTESDAILAALAELRFAAAA